MPGNPMSSNATSGMIFADGRERRRSIVRNADVVPHLGQHLRGQVALSVLSSTTRILW